MSTRSQVCAWMSAGVLLAAPATAQERTERDIVELIVRDGPQAAAIRADADVIRREQLARQVFPNPSVAYTREGAGFTEFLQVEQALPLFGTRGALSRAGVAATAAAEAEREARLWTLRTEAAIAVARLASAQVHADTARTQIGDIERLIDILRTREREGEGSRFDRLRAEQELRESQQLALAATASAAEARAAVRALLPPSVTIDRVAAASAAPAAADAAALQARALAARAELRALQQSRERTDHESEAARRLRFPMPTVFGGLKRADVESGRESGGVFGVSLPVPLFDTGGREAARWEAERARVDAARAAIEQEIRSEIARASELLALRQAAVAADAPGAGDELITIAVVAYREGEMGILELLDAARTASRARLRTIELRRDARLAQIALERAVGEALWP